MILISQEAYKKKNYIDALEQTFKEMDSLLAERIQGVSSSTAIVVLITPHQIISANIGDTRSVLCRNGMAVNMS